MSEHVNPRRRYDSTRRQAQAAQTREDILEAAHVVFVEHGYGGATLARIARRGGVVVETIYRGFGSKAGLFKSVVEAAVAGGVRRADVPVEERPAIQAVIAEPDARRQIELYAATQPGIHQRLGPLFAVLAEAAATHPELEAVRAQLEGQRLDGMRRFAEMLADRGSLRRDLSPDEARDLLWTVTSHAVYEMLVIHRGWSPERYETWLARALAEMLLAPRSR